MKFPSEEPPAGNTQQVVTTDQQVVDDLVLLVVRLARRLRTVEPSSELSGLALDYVRKRGLEKSPLRAENKAGD